MKHRGRYYDSDDPPFEFPKQDWDDEDDCFLTIKCVDSSDADDDEYYVPNWKGCDISEWNFERKSLKEVTEDLVACSTDKENKVNEYIRRLSKELLAFNNSIFSGDKE